MLETIYVTRHAFRCNLTVNRDTGTYEAGAGRPPPTGIPTDVELTSHGVDQSRQLGDHLCSIDPPVDRVYSSPFYRCLQTLEPTTSRLFSEGKAGGKIRLEHGLGEFYGRAPFLHPTPPQIDQLKVFFKDLDEEYASKHIPNHNGEYIRELHDRVKKAVGDIIESLDNDPQQPKTLLICTHAAVMIALGRVLTGNMPDDPDTDDFQCYTASLSTFKRRSDAAVGSWDCFGNAETHFLEEGPERGWHFKHHRKDWPMSELQTSGWGPERSSSSPNSTLRSRFDFSSMPTPTSFLDLIFENADFEAARKFNGEEDFLTFEETANPPEARNSPKL